MEKIKYENISGLHLELTTKCNACCPMCSRNFKGSLRKDLKMGELSLEDCKKIMPPDFIKQLKLISVCGVYGDPIHAKDLLEILKYIYSCNQTVDIDIYTNGSVHDTSFWENLAEVVKPYNGTVVFGIDGIGDVHSLHRCNTNYDTIIKNATAYINAGGKAQWDYIVFKHNEHQVEEARALSEKLGFKIFQVKKTSRFFKNLYESDEALDSTILAYGKHPVYNSKGEITHHLELPENKCYRNNQEDNIFEIIKTYGSMSKYLDTVCIDCQAIRTHGVFISAFGEVFPCCTVYQQVCYGTVHGVTDKTELNEYNLSLTDDLSAFNRPIKDIVEGEFFNNLQNSWQCSSLTNGKPKSCSRACGKELDVHSAGHTTTIKHKG